LIIILELMCSQSVECLVVVVAPSPVVGFRNSIPNMQAGEPTRWREGFTSGAPLAPPGALGLIGIDLFERNRIFQC
jgi:hypothetical protein